MGLFNTVGFIFVISLTLLASWFTLYLLYQLPQYQQAKNMLGNLSQCETNLKPLIGEFGRLIYCRLFSNLDLIIYLMVVLSVFFSAWAWIRKTILGQGVIE